MKNGQNLRIGCIGGAMTELERHLQMQIADYIRLQYPDVLFHSDFGSGIKLTPGQSRIQYRQNGGRRGWPDMFIAAPRVRHTTDGEFGIKLGWAQTDDGADYYAMMFAGLFLEIKRDGTRLKKKNGEWSTTHIKEQANVLHRLRKRGYSAEFAVGFDEAKKIIDEYLR